MWKGVWQTHCPPQHNQTYFLLLHNAHWTGQRASKMSILLRPGCTCTAPETEDHIFYECPIAQNAWKIAWKVLKSEKVRLPPLTLRAILQPPPNKPLLRIHRLTLHTLWVERCNRVFQKPPPTTPLSFLVSLPLVLAAAF